jgi:hypothetical protein
MGSLGKRFCLSVILGVILSQASLGWIPNVNIIIRRLEAEYVSNYSFLSFVNPDKYLWRLYLYLIKT